VQEKGLSAYLAELIGTLLLVFFITSVVSLYVSTGANVQFGTDFAVVGLVQGLALFGVICMFGTVSGGHFNPAVTLAAATIRRISVLDAVIYILAQLSGAVLGALLTKALLTDTGRAVHYGAGSISGLLSGNAHVAGAVVEGLGAFALVMVVLSVVFSEKSLKDWGPLAIGTTFVFLVMVGGPLTGACYNPARWFGAALVSNEWGGTWPYIVGPIVGSLLAVGVWRFVIEAGGRPPTEPPQRVPASGEPKDGKGSKGFGLRKGGGSAKGSDGPAKGPGGPAGEPKPKGA
jgi:MIP family channel proteins